MLRRLSTSATLFSCRCAVATAAAPSCFYLNNNNNNNNNINTNLPARLAAPRRSFSSDVLNPPSGGSTNRLLDSIRESHETSSGLRAARNEQEQWQQQQKQRGDPAVVDGKYRDGLRAQQSNPSAGGGGQRQHGAAEDETSPLHFRAPTNALAIGRDQLVLSMWQGVLSGRRAIFVSSPDGMGASTVAAQFAEHARRSGRFSCIQWFSGSRRHHTRQPRPQRHAEEGKAAAAAAVEEFPAVEALHQDPVEQLTRFVSQVRGRREAEVLLVFDHFADPAAVLNVLQSTFLSSMRSTLSEKESASSAAGGPDDGIIATLTESDLRSHASRVHLVFATADPNPVEELHRCSVGSGSAGGKAAAAAGDETTSASATPPVTTLATVFCPSVYTVGPLDRVPAMLLLERLVSIGVAEEERSGAAAQQQDAGAAAGAAGASELDENVLTAACEAVACVPLLLNLLSRFLVAHLAAGDKSLEHVVEELLPPVLAPAHDSETNSLSVSAAAVALCQATTAELCGASKSGGEEETGAVDPELLRRVMQTVLTLNIATVSRVVLDALIASRATSEPAAKSERWALTARVSSLLRRTGFFVDATTLVDANNVPLVPGGGGAGASVDSFDSRTASAAVFDIDDRSACHVTLAQGMLNAYNTAAASAGAGGGDLDATCRALLGIWPRRMRGASPALALELALHADALLRFHSPVTAYAAPGSDSAPSLVVGMKTAAAALPASAVALFGKAAAFLAHAAESHLDVAIRLWLCVFFFNVQQLPEEQQSAAAAVQTGLELGRVLLASPCGSSAERETRVAIASMVLAEAAGIARGAETTASSSECESLIAARNVSWAKLTALRARLLPETEKTLAELAAAAQIIENEVSNLDEAMRRSAEENAMLVEEHFVLLVAWAKFAEALGRTIPEAHWAKMQQKLKEKMRR